MNILVGYDGSKVAQAALELAKTHAEKLGAALHIVTSMEGGPDVPREVFEKAEKQLEAAKAGVRENGIACETHLSVRGLQPGEDLVQYAEENSIEQIIIGVRQRSKVGKLLFGSTAQHVILEAPCPVVSVK